MIRTARYLAIIWGGFFFGVSFCPKRRFHFSIFPKKKPEERRCRCPLNLLVFTMFGAQIFKFESASKIKNNKKIIIN